MYTYNFSVAHLKIPPTHNLQAPRATPNFAFDFFSLGTNNCVFVCFRNNSAQENESSQFPAAVSEGHGPIAIFRLNVLDALFPSHSRLGIAHAIDDVVSGRGHVVPVLSCATVVRANNALHWTEQHFDQRSFCLSARLQSLCR